MKSLSNLLVVGVAAAITILCLIFVGALETVALALAISVIGFVLHRRVAVDYAIAWLFFMLVLIPELQAAPPVVQVAGVSIYIPHLLGAALFPFVDFSKIARDYRRLLWGFVLLVAWMGLFGLLRGAPLAAVLQDARGPLTFVCGVFAASVIYSAKGMRGILKLVPPVLVASVALIGIQLVTGAQILGGRVRGATVFGGVGQNAISIDATRFIVSSEDLAVVSLLVVGWWLAQKSSLLHKPVLALGVTASASVLIILLSLSRQLLVGIAVGTLAWIFTRHGIRRLTRITVSVLPFVAVGLLALTALTLAGQGIGSSNVVGRQLDGFSQRVLVGLTSEGIEADAGTNWRQRENAEAISLISAEPLGTGLGLPYRDEFAVEAFGDPTFFRRWVHNVYLWYGTKGGGLGFLAIGLVTLVPLLRAVKRARTARPLQDPVAEVAVPLFCALGVMSLVDPVIINANSGVITATVFLLLGLRARPTVTRSRSAGARSVERVDVRS